MNNSKYIYPKISKKKISNRLYKSLGMANTMDLDGQQIFLSFSCVFVVGPPVA